MSSSWDGISGYGNCNNYVPYGVDGRIIDPTHGYWLSCRPCFECGKIMHTNGKQFKCLHCGEVIPIRKKAG